MLDPKLIKTVCDSTGKPILEVVREEGTITIFEADDMDRQVKFPAALMPGLVDRLQDLK